MAERKLLDLNAESEKYSNHISALKRKAKEDMEKLAEMENRKSKEVAAINKQYEDSQKKLRQLENANDNLRKKLDRKTEEISAISKKIKEGGQLSTRVSRTSLTHESLKTMMSEIEMRYCNLFSSVAKPENLC